MFHCEYCGVSEALFPAHHAWCKVVETCDVVSIAYVMQETDRLSELLRNERAENERLSDTIEVLKHRCEHLEKDRNLLAAENERLQQSLLHNFNESVDDLCRLIKENKQLRDKLATNGIHGWLDNHTIVYPPTV